MVIIQKKLSFYLLIYFLQNLGVWIDDSSTEFQLYLQSNLYAAQNQPIANKFSTDNKIKKEKKKKYFKNNPTYSSDTLLSKAFFFYYSKNRKNAFQYFKKYVEIYGDNEVALRYMAHIMLKIGKTKVAIKFLERGVLADKTRISSLLLLGETYENKNDIKNLISVYKKVTDIDPFNEKSIETLGRFYIKQKKTFKASIMYKRLILAVNKHGGSNEEMLYQAYANLGNYYYQESEYKKSIKYYNKLLELDTTNDKILLILGELFKITGQFNKAIIQLKKLIQLKPNYSAGLESLLECYYILDQGEAKRIVKKLLKNKRNLLLLAMNYELEKKDKKSESYFKKILEQNSSRLSAHIGLAKIYKRNNNQILLKQEAFTIIILSQKIGAYEIAQKYFTDVIEIINQEKKTLSFDESFFLTNKEASLLLDNKIERLAIDIAEAYSTHANTMDGLYAPFQAIVYFRESLKIIDQLTLWYRSQTQDLLKAKIDKSNAKLKEIGQKSNSLNAKKYSIILSMGWILQESPMLRFKEALILLEVALKLEPSYPQAMYLKGMIYYNMGEHAKSPEKSNSYFNQSMIHLKNAIFSYEIKKMEIPSTYHFYFGMALEKLDKFPLAEKHLLKTIELEPNNPTYLNFLGYMYSLRTMKLPTATKLISKALENEPDNEAYLDSLGWILFKSGKYNEALQQLLQAANQADKRDKTDPIIYYHLAETYFKLNDYSLAHYYFTRTLTYIQKASEPLDINNIKQKISILAKKKKKKKNEK